MDIETRKDEEIPCVSCASFGVVKRLEAEIKQLQADLKKYGSHFKDCNSLKDFTNEEVELGYATFDCNCGFEQALNTPEPPSASV